MLRVPYQDLFDCLLGKLLRLGFGSERAQRCAQLFAETNRDGVYSHGLNRFPRFLAMIESGHIDIHAQPELVSSFAAIERWDGRIGPGNLNAWHSMARAIARFDHRVDHRHLAVADQIVGHFQLPRDSPGERVRYPGYRVLQTRKENLANGVPVDTSIWQQLQSV